MRFIASFILLIVSIGVADVIDNNAGPIPSQNYYRSEVHVNCGGKSNEWFQSDIMSEKPSWLSLHGNYSFSSGDMAHFITGTESRNIYALRSLRAGRNGKPFGYKLKGMENGMHECQLHFAEKNPKYFQIGSRVMTTTINGDSISDIDVYNEAGGKYKALRKTFKYVRVRKHFLDVWIKPTVTDFYPQYLVLSPRGKLRRMNLFRKCM